MNTVSTNQIADILHFNDNSFYETTVNLLLSEQLKRN